MTDNPFASIAPDYPLDHIDPNPYNCRLSEDPEHVKKVALSIGTEGLLQIPVGRLVGGKTPDGEDMLHGNNVDMLINGGHRIQLAFGHTRLAAFKFLSDTGNPGFELMPVVLRELTDDEMFRLGISENLARKDLTPVEEARAMLRYRDEFGKTSEEIGSLFNLSGPTVRNKIRLLQLPPEILEKLAVHELSESAARALLELFDLPEELRQSADGNPYDHYRPKNIVDAAFSGEPADNILERISGLIRNYSEDLAKATWKWDEEFAGYQLVGACKGCEFNIKNDKKNYCLKTACFRAKVGVMKKRYLEAASALVGISVIEGDSDTSNTTFNNGDRDTLTLARSIHCPNLRLKYDDWAKYHETDSDHLKEIGYPNAQICCGKQKQWCSCIAAVKAGLQDRLTGKVAAGEKVAAGGDKPLPEVEYVPVESSEDAGDPPAITVDELKDIGREARQQKKQAMIEIEAMYADAAKQIAAGLLDVNTNPRLLLELLRVAGGRAYEIDTKSNGDFSDNPQAWCDEIRLMIGRRLVYTTAENYYYAEPDPARMLKRLNEFLKKAGLDELASVSVETEGDEL